MKMKTVYTSVLKYAKRIRIIIDEYDDGNTYIGLYTMNGEPYADITTNIPFYPLPVSWGYVEANSEAERFIQEQKLGRYAYDIVESGFVKYHTYDFSSIGGKP